jgi:hypothetical protein
MGKINIHNYEAYLLDYLEGQLADPLRAEMQAFLSAHPEIASDAEGLDAVRLDAEALAFPNPASLYQAEAAILEETREKLFLQAADGSLDQEGEIQLALWLKEHPESGREYRAAMLTRLLPDAQIAFPDKSILKKSIPLYRKGFFVAASRIAAVFLLLLLSLTLIRLPEDEPLLVSGDMLRLPPDRLTSPQLPPRSGSDQPAEPIKKMEDLPAAPLQDEPLPGAIAASESTNKAAIAPSILAEPLFLDPLAPEVLSQSLIPAAQTPAWIAYRSTPYNKTAAIKSLIASGPEPEAQGRLFNISWLLGKQARSRTASHNEGWITNPVFWDIADAGISTINALTDQRLTLERDVDDEGNTISYALYNDGFEITRKRRFE